MTQLGRAAKGLPRYFMDCGWYRAPRFAGLGVDALFVFEAAVGYCTEHGTDGALPAHPEHLAAALGVRPSVVRRALLPLLERQALAPAGDDRTLQICGWAVHNPTSEEVEQVQQERSRAGALGNHKRWHVGRGVIDPACELCVPTGSPGDRTSDRRRDRSTDRPPSPGPSHGIGSDRLGWDRNPSSSPPPEPGDGDIGPTDDELRAEASRRTDVAIAAGRCDPQRRPGYLATTLANLRAERWRPPAAAPPTCSSCAGRRYLEPTDDDPGTVAPCPACTRTIEPITTLPTVTSLTA